MYLIEHYEETPLSSKLYDSEEELLEVISSLKDKKITFKVFHIADITNIFKEKL